MVKINFLKWMVFVLGLILAVSEIASAQFQCVLPNNEKGACVNIDHCPWLVETIFYKRVEVPRFLIRYLQCGEIDGRVAICCSNGDRHVESANGVDISNHPNFDLLPSSECGPVTTSKLLRTDKLGLSEMPWMARLQYETSSGLELLCEGSIVNNRYILTAARCFSYLWRNKILISVILGEHDSQTEVDCETRGTITKCHPPKQEFSIEKTIPHKTDDIGLIRLSKSIIFDQDHIQPICLPKSNETLKFKLNELLISGWGRRSNGVLDNTPSKVLLSVHNIETCRKKYDYFLFTNNDKQFCAHKEDSKDSCEGALGSALVHPFVSNGYKYFQFGMFSYGPSNCTTGPGVYLNIQKYMDWILDNIDP